MSSFLLLQQCIASFVVLFGLFSGWEEGSSTTAALWDVFSEICSV